MRKRMLSRLMLLISLTLLAAACGLGSAEEDEYVCEPPADSQWTATATPRSGNCPQEWVDLGKDEIVGRSFTYSDEGLECGTNYLDRTITDYNCEVSVEEDVLVFDGELGETYVTYSVECPEGATCTQGYEVEYSRGSNGSTNNDEDSTTPPSDTCHDQSFRDTFMERTFSTFYYAGSEGTRECEEGAVCFHEQYVFYPDGTYSHVHNNMGELGDYTELGHRICVFGQWSATCDTITLSDCRRTQSHSLRVQGDSFSIGPKVFTEARVVVDPVRDCQSKPCN